MKLHPLLAQSIFEGAFIITSTSLWAERLHQIWIQHCLDRNIKTFEKPTILSIEDWIMALCNTHNLQDLTNYKKLLKPLQSKQLMQGFPKTIAQSPKQTYEAWKIYQLLSTDPHTVYAFAPFEQPWLKLTEQFTAQCRLTKSRDIYHYLSYLLKADLLKTSDFPKKVGLVGLQTTHFAYQMLFKYLSQNNCLVESTNHLPAHVEHAVSLEIHPYVDLQTEVYKIACHVWQQWKEHPKDTIGCTVFNLKAVRNTMMIAFQNAYHTIFDTYPAGDYPLILPLETVLFVQHPLIQTALDILNLDPTFIQLAPLSRLFRTLYIHNHHFEQIQCIKLEKALRNHASTSLSLQFLIEQAKHHNCLGLVNILQQWAQQYSTFTPLQSYSAWAKHFQDQLKIWGWSKLSNISSEELYYIKLWDQQLAQLASLDLVQPPVDYHSALQAFKQIIESVECPLQIQMPKQGIYLIDLEGTAYFRWEKLWIIYSSSLYALPNHYKHPLIPAALQEANNTYNLHFDLLKAAIHACKASRISVLEEEYTQVTFQLSQFMPIANHDLKKIEYSNTEFPWFTQMQDAIQWEYQQDYQSHRLLEQDYAFQEAKLLQIQSLCPFRAFSDYRLGLRGALLSWPKQALSYTGKHKLLYQLLQTVWHELQTQSKLKSLSDNALNQLLKRVIDNTVKPFIEKQPWIWQPIFTRLEKERLSKLLAKWLEIEKLRPSFKVMQTQPSKIYDVGPLQIPLSVDRIDQLADGKLLLLRYKFDSTRSAYHRMNYDMLSLQLPLYALSAPSQTKALALLQFPPNHHPAKFEGISQEDVHIPGIHTLSDSNLKVSTHQAWNHCLRSWHTQLEILAKQFAEGEAMVKPKEGAKSCKSCQYSLLCRIKEINTTET